MKCEYVSALYLLVSLTCASEPPKVYEEDSPELTRKPRQPEQEYFTRSELTSLKAAQQDPRQRRYHQQQLVDSHNMSKIREQLKKINDDEHDPPYDQKRQAVVKTWKLVHPKFVTEKEREKRENRRNNDERSLQRHELIDLGGTYGKNPMIFYFESLRKNNLPSPSNQDLNALNSLLGKTPTAQLRGLQQLLHSHAVKVAPLHQQDHTPIEEHVVDVENPQTKPNIKVEPQPVELNNLLQIKIQQSNPNLNELQAHLDAVSQIQANEAIAQAQQKALENVKRQHEAIALAKIEAEKIALAQVQSQNLALAQAQADTQAQALAHAQALAQAETALIHENALQKVAEEEKNRRDSALKLLHRTAEEVRAKNVAIHAQRQAEAYKKNLHPVGAASFVHPQALALVTQGAETHEQQSLQQHYEHEPSLRFHEKQPIVELQEQRNLEYHEQPNLRLHEQPIVELQEQRNLEHYEQPSLKLHEQPIVVLHEQPNLEHQEQSSLNHHQESSSRLHEQPIVVLQEQPNLDHQEQSILEHQGTNHESLYDEREYNEYASKYSFGYRVRDYHSGNDFGHEESKEGKVIKGRYDVLLPDGRIQYVEYWADHSGYHAKVSYSNVAHH